MTQSKISRRTVLKGLGGITVGLPLLEEMMITRGWGAPVAEVPTQIEHHRLDGVQQPRLAGFLEPLPTEQVELLGKVVGHDAGGKFGHGHRAGSRGR